MTPQDIERIAREAGFQCFEFKAGLGYDPIKLIQPVSSTNMAVELSRFAALVRAEALEDAAKEIDNYLYADKAAERLRTLAASLSSKDGG